MSCFLFGFLSGIVFYYFHKMIFSYLSKLWKKFKSSKEMKKLI